MSLAPPAPALALALPALLVALGSLSCMPALASTELARKHSCTACHAADRKLVGPAYRDVAKRYGGDKDAVTHLAASIRAGGSGKWGPVPMPAQPKLSDAEARALAAWVLGGAR